MKLLKTTVGVAGLAALAISLPLMAQADQTNTRSEKLLERLDLNDDGLIAKSEVDRLKADRFLKADTNGDNLMSEAEFAAFMDAEKARREAERRSRTFAAMDANGDGFVTADEHAAHTPKGRRSGLFDRLDGDGDGFITQLEREAAMKAMLERRAENGG
ncbi:MAG: hypothetical protein AAGF20_12105, partial [Pseudomonadota bacterium]